MAETLVERVQKIEDIPKYVPVDKDAEIRIIKTNTAVILRILFCHSLVCRDYT